MKNEVVCCVIIILVVIGVFAYAAESNAARVDEEQFLNAAALELEEQLGQGRTLPALDYVNPAKVVMVR